MPYAVVAHGLLDSAVPVTAVLSSSVSLAMLTTLAL